MKAVDTHATHEGHILRIAVGTMLILLIPLIAMQFSDEVAWGLIDFVVIGVLLFGTGLVYELISRRLHNARQRLMVAAAAVFVVLVVWAELAVGIFN